MARVLPVGIHFIPTQEELIDMLMNFLQGKLLPSIPVVKKVLYGKNATPWHIFSEDDPWQLGDGDAGKKEAKKVIYVLTQLSKMGKKNIARTAGCGRWEAQTGSTDVKNSKGQIIGVTKILTFRVKGDSNKEDGHWTMNEYALAGESLRNFTSNDYVICKITRDYSKCYRGQVFEKPRNYPVLGKRTAADVSIVEAEDSENSNTSKRFGNNVLGDTTTASDSMSIDSDSETSIGAEALMELPNTADYVENYVGQIDNENNKGQIIDETSTCSDSATPIAAEALMESLPNTANYVVNYVRNYEGLISDDLFVLSVENLANNCVGEFNGLEEEGNLELLPWDSFTELLEGPALEIT